MAAYAITIDQTSFNGVKLNRQVTANAEDTYTVSITNTSAKSWYLQAIWTTASGLYHTTAAQVVANGNQVPAGMPYNIPIGKGSIFYIAATGAGTIDFVAYTY